MAGNTKLLGFTPDGKVALERWNTTAYVTLPAESLLRLREACYKELPKKPAQHEVGHLPNFSTEYDEKFGVVRAVLTMEGAEKTVSLLRLLLGNEYSSEQLDLIAILIEELKKGLEAHAAFHNTTNEPGVDDAKPAS